MIRLLSKNDIEKILTVPDTINILEKAFAEFAKGKAEMPDRTYINIPEYNGMKLIMPGYLKDSGILGTKVVSVYRDNPLQYGIPSTIGTIILLDDKTGEPISIMDGTQITAYRTGAVAGLAAKYLSRENSYVHTLFGTGGMAESHAVAVDAVRTINKLFIISTSSSDQKSEFARNIKDKIDCEIVIADNAEEAVRESDIVSMITTAKEPLLNNEWIKPGTHIYSAGSHSPLTREIDTATIINAKCYCDSIEACKMEAGDFLIPEKENNWSWDKLQGTLGQICTGELPGRENGNDITVFKSVGLAIQDLATAGYVYKKSIEFGIGSEFKF